MGSAVTRRTFLARTGLAAAALAAAGTGSAALLQRTTLARPRLTPGRRRTYVALVDAAGRGTVSQIDPAQAAAAADELAADYAQALEPTRAAIDDVLDRIERAPRTAPFSRLDPAARLDTLRRLADRDLAARALALAAAPFHPPAGDFHPTPVTL